MIRQSLRRPVAVAMAYGAVALLGVAAWRNVPIEVLPDTQLPQLNVTASWRGASPETVEAFLTAPLESAIQQVRGVERIVSTSSEDQGMGRAEIIVEFDRDVDMDFTRLDLSERLATLEESLPPGADRVEVEQYVPQEFAEQNRPFLLYTFTGPYTLEALRRHLEEVVVPELGQVPGVALVSPFGGRERRLEIELDEEAIAALGVDAAAVRRAIMDLDLVREAGVIRDGGRERTITVVNRPQNAEDVRQAFLTVAGGTPVRVADVARVYDNYEEARAYSRFQKQPAVGFQVWKSSGVNTVRVADAAKVRMAELERLAPYGATHVLEFDQSELIRTQFADLRTRAVFSALVIFLVLLAFLRSFRSAGLIFATIAFSVLIAINLIYFGGLTLNLLTLMGLALGFGLIVDNAIVVLENVFRRRQRGESADEAAEHGTREVVLPIMASTATTLIVFVPFVYLQGELRVFYVPLAIVVGLTLIASLLVAFTFIPSIAARIMDARRAGPSRVRDRPPLYARFYSDVVGFTVRHPWPAIILTLVVFVGSFQLFDRYVSRWAMWGGGFGADTYIRVNIDLPRGSSLERTDELVRYFEDRVEAMPEVERFTAQVMPTSAMMEITFPDSLENTVVPVVIKEQMVAFSHTFTGATVRVYGFGPSFYGGGGSPPNYGIQVLGYNYERVRDIAEDIGTRLTRLSRVVEVDTNASSNRFQRDRASEFTLEIDRDRLARHEITVEEVVQGIGAAAAGNSQLTYVKLGGEEVQVQVKLASNQDLDVLALQETLIPTPSGQRIRLGDVVTVAQREVLAQIRRENQQYERTVAYEFRGPARLGDLVHEAVMAGTDVPPGYTVQAGRNNWFVSQEQRDQIWMVLAIALVLVYMVTAALFESLLRPLCVILTVPMALIGVYLIFFYTGASFTREAYIGVIMMLGIVVNNAILLVDHVNRVRAEAPELSLDAAIVRGTVERVRPILMTTITTVLGLLPLVVFGDGAGSNIWDALALVLIGGLLSSTLFVLTITPAVYRVLEGLRPTGVPAWVGVPGAPGMPGRGGTPPGAPPVGGNPRPAGAWAPLE